MKTRQTPRFSFTIRAMALTSSPRLAQALARIGIHTERDVLMHFPYRYEDLTATPLGLYHDQQRLVLVGKITSTPQVFRRGTFVTLRFTMRDQHQHLMHVIAFNRPFLAKSIVPNTIITIVGKYDASKQIVHLVTFILGEVAADHPLKPIYRLPHEIPLFRFTALVKKALTVLPKLEFETRLPKAIIQEKHLLDPMKALPIIHQPASLEAVQHAMLIFKYEEAYTFVQTMQAIRQENMATIKSHVQAIAQEAMTKVIKHLPYALTEDQRQAVDEIIGDMRARKRMYRLLQGDVGSGKTVVAALALYANYLRKQQGALMAPTDALAKQHYLTLQQLLTNLGVSVTLLVGSMSSSEKRAIKESLLNGTIDIVVGTHTLFSSDTTFFSLGLAVIDEQHRFGVNQRALLKDKGRDADLLMMSATPIPRSLAMSVYADMDISTLIQFPFSARLVKTKIVTAGDALIHYTIATALEQHQRVFVIAPKINESLHGKDSVVKLFDHYQRHYPKQVGLLHGQLDAEEKDHALKAFSQGHRPILVSTTVIEVGIDVKQASVMIIHDADSFGLASLHQLRGRIGRDGREALCLLVVQEEDQEGQERLQVLVDTHDGFKIAEADLRMRGPGELMGLRQSGVPGFQYLNLVIDQPIIQYVKQKIIK
jgi:ATP-dependent DNA helicase RecG